MRVSVTSRTAVYGPVRTVVWEGWSRKTPPYPDPWRKAAVEVRIVDPPLIDPTHERIEVGDPVASIVCHRLQPRIVGRRDAQRLTRGDRGSPQLLPEGQGTHVTVPRDPAPVAHLSGALLGESLFQ